ncbi:MAG: hypothetical protein R3E03_05750 [Novosphingobium sp.]
MICSISSFRPSGSLRQPGRAMRHRYLRAGEGALARAAAVRDLPGLLRQGDVLVFNDTA